MIVVILRQSLLLHVSGKIIFLVIGNLVTQQKLYIFMASSLHVKTLIMHDVCHR